MADAVDQEHQDLLRALNVARAYLFECLEGLDERAVRSSVLPSGWTVAGLVNHLAVDVERFWFEAIVAGDQDAFRAVESSGNAWNVAPDASLDDVLDAYRLACERADRIIEASDLNAAPSWWPDFFGAWRLDTIRGVVLHVIRETATHGGQLDVARELLDGKLHVVLTD